MRAERHQGDAGTLLHQESRGQVPRGRRERPLKSWSALARSAFARSALGLGASAVLALTIGACGEGEGDADDREDAPLVEEALARQALSKPQEKAALKAIDDICGDTWCSGDYDFGFRKLNCDQTRGTCTLTFQVFPREGVVSARRSYWRSCKTPGFTGFASVVRTAPNGYQSLDPGYYDALTVCIGAVLDKLAHPPKTS